ncbi:hypothetical protein ACIRRT_40980, partial [Streptomyces sp. NPDC102256]|uniref:hypothetical protein n=1 Tax=Streptomyces sp. NPDC102256 TaxID=3366147 RepID=UPI0037F21569
PSPLNQTSVERRELLDPGVSDGHVMYRHGPSCRMPTAGSDWLGRVPFVECRVRAATRRARPFRRVPGAGVNFSPSGD